jgi:hypothetical protein
MRAPGPISMRRASTSPSGIGRLGVAWFARHWLSAGHLLRQPSECAGAGQDPAAGSRDNPRHRWRAHAASLSIAKLVFGAEKASRDQAGRAPRWRLLAARRPGVDIIAGASLARRTVNLPLSIVKNPAVATGPVRCRQVRGGLEKMLSLTEGPRVRIRLPPPESQERTI